jgi:cytochrome c peroxidase
MCQFRAPTLRNLAYTAPYYHDGTGATLEDVLKNYERGGRDITSGPYAGDGAVSPLKGPFIRGFPAQATVDGVPYTNDEMVADLLAFLQTLNDPGFVTNPDLSDPNPAQ